MNRFFKCAVVILQGPDPPPVGDAHLVGGDALGLARRGERVVTDAAAVGFLSQLRSRPGSGGEGLTQPGTSLIDDGAQIVTIVRGVPLRLKELGGGPGTLAVPDEASDGGAGDGLEAEGEGGRRTVPG